MYIYVHAIICMLAIKFEKCGAIAHAPDITVHVNENPSSSPLFLLGVARIHMNITPHHKHTYTRHLHTLVYTHTLLKDSKGLYRYCMYAGSVFMCCTADAIQNPRGWKLQVSKFHYDFIYPTDAMIRNVA